MTEALNGALPDDPEQAGRLIGYLIDDVIRNVRGTDRVKAREVMGEVYIDLMDWVRKENVTLPSRWAAYKTAKRIARRKLARATDKEKRQDEYRRGGGRPSKHETSRERASETTRARRCPNS